MKKNYFCSFEKALNVLNRIEQEVCISVWSCKQMLFLNEKIGRLEGNKGLLQYYFENLDNHTRNLIENNKTLLYNIMVYKLTKNESDASSYDIIKFE